MQRVLVIDDQSYVRGTMVIALAANGFEAVTAESGPAGLAALDGSKFDLAIIDVYMPGMDGIQVIKEVRARVGNLPIIAMSGVQLGVSEHTALDHLPKLASMAAVVCLRKPFRPHELLDAVHSALRVTA